MNEMNSVPLLALMTYVCITRTVSVNVRYYFHVVISDIYERQTDINFYEIVIEVSAGIP